MLKALKTILQIQEFDMKMIRLIRLKRERSKELDNMNFLHDDLFDKIEKKKEEQKKIKLECSQFQKVIQELDEQIKQYESKQGSVKKVEEFNALNQEISIIERKRSNIEKYLEELNIKLKEEEKSLSDLKESLKLMESENESVKQDISENIASFNEEGKKWLEERNKIAKSADKDILEVYEKLLYGKKDRVVVPIDRRCCTGCNILLTAQHENLIRRAERLIFCEHCSRILYWQKGEGMDSPLPVKKTRRRRKAIS